jgi:hypothetical protein
MAKTEFRPTGLDDFEIGEKLIESKRGSFAVRGMNTDDLTFLVTNYLEEVVAALAQFGEKHDLSGGRVHKDALGEFFLILVHGFPDIVAEMISRCADRPDLIEKVRRMPFIIHIQALAAIVELTVEDAGGLGNLWAVLRSLLETRNLQVGPLTNRLRAIIETPGATSASSSHTATGAPTDTR